MYSTRSNHFVLSASAAALMMAEMAVNSSLANANGATENKPSTQPVDHCKMAGMSGIDARCIASVKAPRDVVIINLARITI